VATEPAAGYPEQQGMEAFTPDSARLTLDAAAAEVGLDADGAELLRLGENAVYRLGDSVIARVARSADREGELRSEVDVARWLQSVGYPAVRALPVEQPAVVGDRAVTFWRSVADTDDYASPREVAGLLRRLHGLEPPTELSLPALAPFARAERRRSEAALPKADRSFLGQRLRELRSQYQRLRFDLPPGVIHGDASVGNVIRDAAGQPVVIDLDGFAIGPREWDLVLTALYFDRFGWHTQQEYEEFVDVYGVDVMRWDGYPVLADVREFLMVTWLSQKAGDGARTAEEVGKRIEALRTGGSRRDWLPY
jgi:Ser/Thr protein kinase RdoA (MazF antagonist)